jgi:hypothetical protein
MYMYIYLTIAAKSGGTNSGKSKGKARIIEEAIKIVVVYTLSCVDSPDSADDSLPIFLRFFSLMIELKVY